MKKVSYPLNINKNDFNTNNLYENNPYKIDSDNVLVIDDSWWDTLTPGIKDMLHQRLKDPFKIEKVSLPQTGYQSDKRLSIVHQTFQDGHDFHVWYGKTKCAPPNVLMIKLSEETKKALCTKDVNNLTELKTYLDKVCDGKQKYFVRTSSTSGKNEIPVSSFTDPDKIISHLLTVKEFVHREFERVEKDTYIILVPWNPLIDSRTEFRLFVVNRKLTCASPQKWWECHNYTSDELSIIENALLKSSLYQDSPYDSFVADVYVDMDKQTCNLIEINCFGDHSGAGSSLFNWEEDHDLLYGKYQEPELRFLSVFSYAL